MIAFSQLRRYSFNTGSMTNEGFLDLLKSHTFKEPDKLQQSSVGWLDSFEPQLVSGALAPQFVVALFGSCVRIVPSVLLNNALNERMRSSVVPLTKNQVTELKTKIQFELAPDMPATMYTVATFYIESLNELWLLASNKEHMEYASNAIVTLLFNKGLSPKLHRYPVSKGWFKNAGLNGLDRLSVESGTVKIGKKTMPFNQSTDPEFTKNIIGNMDAVVDRMQFSCADSDILMCINAKGEIHNIAAQDGLHKSWKEEGDPQSVEMLNSILTAIWVSEVVKFDSCILRTLDSTTSADDSGDDDLDLQQVAEL